MSDAVFKYGLYQTADVKRIRDGVGSEKRTIEKLYT
jgi:hypothetical protein